MVEIIAHRGARSLAPENTLAAARLAHKIGAHRWETDVGLTRDGLLVLFHDTTLTRCTNGPDLFGYDLDSPLGDKDPMARLDQYLLMELQALDAGSHFAGSDPFGTISEGAVDRKDALSYTGEIIPSLEQGLELTRQLGWKINVELKDHGQEPEPYYTASRTLAAIGQVGLGRDQVTISSFDHDWLRFVRDRSDIEIQALVGDDDDIPLDFNDPVFTGSEFMVLNINAKLISSRDIKTLKSDGKQVNLFTVNEPHDYMRFVTAGVDGIFTDFPQRFIR